MAYEPRARVDLSGQTGSIGATTITTAPAAGLYRVAYYIGTTAAGSAGTVLMTLAWNDGVAQSLATSAISLATIVAGTLAQGAVIVRCAAGQAITYATTAAGIVGNPQYSLTIRLEAL